MAKQGMKRMQRTHKQPENNEAAVPEIQGKAKHSNEQVRPIIEGTYPPAQKVFHTKPYARRETADNPISEIYREIDNDLARDNLENNITAADLQDLQ